MAITASEFDEVIRKNFIVDGLSDLDLRRVYVAWHEFAEDYGAVRALEWALRPADGHKKFGGQLWWEQRILAGTSHLTCDESEHVTLWGLTRSKDLVGRARPYCPSELLGTWRCVSRKTGWDESFVGPAETVEWTLGADGAAKLVGIPAIEGHVWKSSARARPKLWFNAPKGTSTQQWTIVAQDGDRMEVCHPRSDTELHFERVGTAP